MFQDTGAKTPDEYISKLDEPRRTEVQKIHDFIRKVVPELDPFMISGMIGYGKYHYKSPSGREGDWAIIALSSRVNYISIYACAVEGDQYVAEKYKSKIPHADIGKSCIRYKKFENIDWDGLEAVLQAAAKAPANQM
jgi:hypothetical protein